MSKRVRDGEEIKKMLSLKAIFKKVVRGVIINSQWLEGENDDDQTVASDPRKRITFLLRTKRNIGMLTAADKSLIRTPHLIRTIAERKKLCMLFASLKCFFWIPPKLRARLVPVIKFMTLNAGRTIIREGDMPLTVFFIVTGEVEMIKTARNKLHWEADIIFGPGDCIGDVGMVEDSIHAYTFITTTQCELLVLFDNDFNYILKSYMQKIWNEKKKALRALEYFNFLNEYQILNACKLCSLKQFKPLETIYSQDKGTLTNVHFVLSGECAILQCLNMKVSTKNGKKVHELVDTLDDVSININSDSSINKKEEESIEALDVTNKTNHKSFGKSTLDVELACGMFNDNQITTLNQFQNSVFQANILHPELSAEENTYCREEEYNNISSEEILKIRSHEPEQSIIFKTELSTQSTESESSTLSSSVSNSSGSTSALDIYESHFIDVGSLTFGGIFGLGEQSQNRVIMARNTVQCLLLPRYFLLDKEQNPGNIWQRRCFYLDCIIPSRQVLFEDFLKSLKWKKFKNDFIKQCLVSNTNDVARDDDIPILCRIEKSR